MGKATAEKQGLVRILSLALFLDCIALAFVPCVGWISATPPHSGWLPFFDSFGHVSFFGTCAPLRPRIPYLAAVSATIIVMCFGRSIIMSSLIASAFATLSGLVLVRSVPRLGVNIHPAGFAALLLFFTLSVALFYLHLPNGHRTTVQAD